MAASRSRRISRLEFIHPSAGILPEDIQKRRIIIIWIWGSIPL